MASSFSQDISKFVAKTGLKADVVLRKLAFDAFRGLLLASPVDTGRFRGSWTIGINQTSLTVAARASGKATYPGGQIPPDLVASGAAIGQAKFGDTIVLSNNLPYAAALEKGHSKQAPSGVLIVTYERIRTGFAQTVQAAEGLGNG